MKRAIVVVIASVVCVLLILVLVKKFEGKDPVVDIALPSLFLKKDYTMTLGVSDEGTGLRSLHVSLMKQGNEVKLLEKKYLPISILDIFNTTGILEEQFSIPVESWRYGMSDGEAVIRILATDQSWRGWNKGNQTYIEKKVIIDTKPPKVKVLTRRHNVEKGGSGLVIYKVFEPDVKTGVKVGDHVFDGQSGMFSDPDIHCAFIALSHKQGPGTDIAVIAEDVAGNTTRKGFYHYIRDKNFKKDTLNISQGFLDRKITDFEIGDQVVQARHPDNPLLDKFIHINSRLRQENVETILGYGKNSEAEMMWSGRFKRLPGSARRASFADHRTYRHKGKEIGKATHLGIDLASTSEAKIPAANGGKIVMAEFVGIFGQSVIIDHGFGLMSLYSHLSDIHVSEGDTVSTADIIGITGITGLAGGDHLHFSMMIRDVFVNPVEWWDASWIKNNITSKIDFVRESIKQ